MDSLMKPLEDILQEYSLIELDIEIKIKEILDKIQNDCASFDKYDENLDLNSDWKQENEEALNRNKNLLQKLEQTKAKLRSSYCYQLASDNLDSQMKRYIKYINRKYNLSKFQ